MRLRMYLAIFFACGANLWSQATATLTGHILDPRGAGVDQASLLLQNRVSGYHAQTQTGENGSFVFTNVPFHDYQLVVRKEGFVEKTQTVSLQNNIPLAMTITLALEGVDKEITVSEFESTGLVDVEATGTRTQLSLNQIERMPLPPGTQALESILLSFPGFAADANGAILPRGAHNQMTYVIDGMPISDQLTGSFGNGIDGSLVQTIELITGNIPAEYGSKISGVANITTRSGLNSGRRFFGSTELNAAQFDSLGNITQFGG